MVENKEFSDNDYINYRFGEKYKNVDRKEMIKQKQCILNFVKERKDTGKRKKKIHFTN